MNIDQLKLQKIYQVSQKAGQPRLFIQNLPCETACFEPGQDIYVYVDEDEKKIHLQNRKFDEYDTSDIVHVSSRVNAVGKRRPLIDTAKGSFKSIICVNDKVELRVYQFGEYARITISPLQYDFNTMDVESYRTNPTDNRLRLLSLSAGAGVGTSHFKDTGYYTPVQEVEWDEDSCDTLRINFEQSLISNCDIKDCNLAIQADVGLVTLPCNNHSSLGSMNEDMFDNLGIAAAKILLHSAPKIIMFENVPGYYKSKSFHDLQDLLSHEYRFWTKPIGIESWDFGSIAKRDRTYMVAFKDKQDMMEFRFPQPPKRVKRKKLKAYLEAADEAAWKPMHSWTASFESKKEKDNSWADRNLALTFLKEDATLLQCIPKRYRSHSASNSYVLHPNEEKWRFLSITELRKIFSIANWFRFAETTPVWRIYEQIGQSACGLVFRAFANEIARVLSKKVLKKGEDAPIVEVDEFGQVTMALF